MWKIDHRCNIGGPVMDYVSIKTEYNGQKLTRMLCPVCREVLYIVGHDAFDQAVPGDGKGFAILNTHREN